MMYSEIIQHHFFHPYHVGEWPVNTKNMSEGRAGSYAMGAVVQIQLQTHDNTITELRFKAYGNPYLIAAASFTCQLLEGKERDICQQFSYQTLINELKLPQTQQFCAILVEDALMAALKYERE